MNSEVKMFKERILNGIDRLIMSLTNRNVIRTESEEEKYTYCVCFLKIMCDVDVLDISEAICVSQIMKEICLGNIYNDSEKASFQEDANTYDTLFPIGVKKLLIYDEDKIREIGITLNSDELGYILMAVDLWVDDKTVKYTFSEAVNAFYDCSNELIGYNPFIYQVSNDVLTSCRQSYFNGKYCIPSKVTKITKGAFSGVTITGQFVIPQSVELIESGAFFNTVFDELSFAQRESKLNIIIDGFENITINKGKLYIPENVNLDFHSIGIKNSTVVNFDLPLSRCCKDLITGLPISGSNGSAGILYVVREGLVSPYISQMVRNNHNNYLFINIEQKWVAGRKWFAHSFESYSDYVKKSILYISTELNLFMENNLEFVKEYCISILNNYLGNGGRYRLIRGLKYIHWATHEKSKQEILAAIGSFNEDYIFSDEYFDIDNDGYLIDYVPKEFKEQRLYIKIPENVVGIRSNAFLQPSFFTSVEGVEFLYIPTKLKDLEASCLSPLMNLKAIYCFDEYKREDFLDKYLLSDMDKKWHRDTSQVLLINTNTISTSIVNSSY